MMAEVEQDAQHDPGAELRVHPARAAIVAHDLAKAFGRAMVLRNLTLEVSAGEIFGLIGPSGSGKSTTMQLLCGQLRPTNGWARVLDETPTGFSASVRRRIGYLPQRFSLSPDLTIAQNVAFAAGLYGVAVHDRVRAVLELTELWDARARLTRSASGGMQRRAALAAAIVHNPELFFADEPTANLDPILRARLWDHFRDRARNGGTLFITTQYIDEAELCDRVGLMYDGTLIAQGPPPELRRRAFGGDVIEVIVTSAAMPEPGSLRELRGVRAIESPPGQPVRLTVADAEVAIPIVLDALAGTGATVRSIRQQHPTFDEVFIRLIEQYQAREPNPQETTDASDHRADERGREGAA